MPYKPKRFCSYPGCTELTTQGKCEKHRKDYFKEQDQQRGTAHQRGYSYRWQKYSKWFLDQPENVFCKLQLEGCTNLAECVDHIDPPNGPNDPRFWDRNNHQAACLHCNSKKGRKVLIGSGTPFDAQRGQRGRGE